MNIFKKRRRNIRENLFEQTDIELIELLHDLRYFWQSLMSMFILRNSVKISTSWWSFDFRHPIYYPKPKTKQSVKKLAILIDCILFLIYLILMLFGILFLFISTNQSRLASLVKINSTNQLLDLLQSSMDPVSLCRGCPH